MGSRSRPPQAWGPAHWAPRLRQARGASRGWRAVPCSAPCSWAAHPPSGDTRWCQVTEQRPAIPEGEAGREAHRVSCGPGERPQVWARVVAPGLCQAGTSPHAQLQRRVGRVHPSAASRWPGEVPACPTFLARDSQSLPPHPVFSDFPVLSLIQLLLIHPPLFFPLEIFIS